MIGYKTDTKTRSLRSLWALGQRRSYNLRILRGAERFNSVPGHHIFKALALGARSAVPARRSTPLKSYRTLTSGFYDDAQSSTVYPSV
jgi:hypothetical protein